MPTRNVVLTETQARFVEELVPAGRYQNASEVLRDGLRLIRQREQEAADHLQVLREAVVAVGLTDMQAGRYTAISDEEALRSHMISLSEQVLAPRR
ncbi:MAG: type II toxin-antitoxin system ParD family antitoxin [Deltaproteobacteria bacterium]|nr:type II toxin-antitoxin system ParD family antitoxin [Candidatus Anaeroferrophillacea bacterium]